MCAASVLDSSVVQNITIDPAILSQFATSSILKVESYSYGSHKI